MPTYKFHVGQIVQLKLAVNRNIPGGVYEVTKPYPKATASLNIASRA
jgi:hypothetical protein